MKVHNFGEGLPFLQNPVKTKKIIENPPKEERRANSPNFWLFVKFAENRCKVLSSIDIESKMMNSGVKTFDSTATLFIQ